ncbi:cytochrome P450 [Amycolatopsis mediterranei S699]|uniref:Cytochrome P450 n=3 Tax=Amycolatopsis mediterranei TaxID=33910 RepID=A0A0H3D6E7_AMYMU|nr:cytochrome P450 [Amycolatopsis mediterranei]ADJ46181.1 cytochrome P450 [Amycolatopsis mediterranei U32]AEK42972.1 cytochrome P450 [Amycolatopsis mediterranei S699]AFO77892.1 cytochrome P450 [Amycolatopsis mediterranei S699]AGT85020.1 cytochrome P450 [Amycolatopsis mediterranei RB]KDO05717.1 cytochrome P450 [Amycolatopsis mediterranei]
MSAAADEALLSLSTPAGLADPYPIYAKLREETPVFRSEVYDGWVLSRFADCQAVLADGETFRVLDAQWRDRHRPGWRDNPAMVLLTALLPWKNPPEHTRERRLLVRDFTVRRVQELEPAVRRAADRVLDRFADATADGTAVEFVGTVLYPLGMAVIGDLVGVPEADHDRLRRVTDLIGRQVNPAMPAELRAEVDAAAVEFRAYFTELIAQRRAEPRADLTSALLARSTTEVELMSEEEVLNSLLVLFGGGYETTAGALGNGIHALLTHPEQFALLAGDPGLAAGAVEEVLRWDGAAQMSQRAAARPAVLDGREVAADEMVVVLGGAANRDPARFPDPDRFDVTRDAGRGLFFGHGLHLCLGAALARLEMTVLLEQLGKRFPTLRIEGDVVRRPNPALRGMAALPLTR